MQLGEAADRPLREERRSKPARRAEGEGAETRFLPAFRYRWLTPLYDPMMRWVAREGAFKPHLVAQAAIRPGHRVLDLGCGTGTLTLLIKRRHPGAAVVGVDADADILRIAAGKTERAGLDITLDLGTATALPYPDGSFDRVLSSLVFHHLVASDKLRAFRESFRVLRPGGELDIADFGKPHTLWTRLSASLFGRMEEASDNVKGLLPGMIGDAGFAAVGETARITTVFGTITLLRASRPASR